MTMPAAMARRFLFPTSIREQYREQYTVRIAAEAEHQNALEEGLTDLHEGRKTPWEEVKRARGWL